MQILMVPTEDIKLLGRHPNVDKYVMQSIEKHGLLHPITVTGKSLTILLGAKKYLACKELGWTKIPCIVVSEDLQNEFRLLQRS